MTIPKIDMEHVSAWRQSLKCTNYCLDSCRQWRTGKLISLSGQNSLRCEAVYSVFQGGMCLLCLKLELRPDFGMQDYEIFSDEEIWPQR